MCWNRGSGAGGQLITNATCAVCDDCRSIFKSGASSTAGFLREKEAAEAFDQICEDAKRLLSE